MDSLYQTGVKKAETDLLIDQLREVFSRLTTQYKVKATVTLHQYHCQKSTEQHVESRAFTLEKQYKQLLGSLLHM